MRSPNLTAETADKLLQQVETQYDLLQYTLDNWCVWPVLRFPVSMSLLNLPWTQLSEEDKLSISERFFLGVRDGINLKNLKPVKHLVLVSSSNRADIENNLYKDIYFDELLVNIGSFEKIENINNKLYFSHGKSALIPSVMTTNGIYIIAALLAKTGSPRQVNQLANKLHSVFVNHLNLDNFPRKRIAYILRNFYWRKKILVWVINKIHPDNLLLINAYNNHAIVAAAKTKEVKVTEFQHGLVYRHHPGYSWSNYASPYKTNMPIPDRIFLYGDYWKNELESGDFWKNELISVGSLRLDHYRAIRETQTKTSDCNIIITTQGLDIDRLNIFLLNFLDAIGERLPVHLYIKLHPREHNKQPYMTTFSDRKNVSIILGSEMPSTFELLTRANFHASISSTCHYEALGLGIPTLILPFSNHEKVLHLTETGYAFKVNNPNDMSEIVIKYNNQQVPREIGECFFHPNAVNTMIDNLGR